MNALDSQLADLRARSAKCRRQIAALELRKALSGLSPAEAVDACESFVAELREELLIEHDECSTPI